MEHKIELTQEIFDANKDQDWFITGIYTAHRCCTRDSQFRHYKAFGQHPKYYTFTDVAFADQATEIFNERKAKALERIEKSSKIHFRAMGMDRDVSTEYEIDNHRIRADFLNKVGHHYFIEVGSSAKSNKMVIDFAIDRKRQINEGNTCSVGYNFKGLERERKFDYTFPQLLEVVNSYFDCAYTGVEIERYYVSSDEFINKA